MRKRKNPNSFEEFEASELFCPRCRQSVPVRKKLLLALPGGDKYDYLCIHCGSSVGTKTVTGEETQRIII
jgi:DNA-directed RNA polymerase subunit RPC12/RpoP